MAVNEATAPAALHPIFDRMTRERRAMDRDGSPVTLPGDHISREEGRFIFEIVTGPDTREGIWYRPF